MGISFKPSEFSPSVLKDRSTAMTQFTPLPLSSIHRLHRDSQRHWFPSIGTYLVGHWIKREVVSLTWTLETAGCSGPKQIFVTTNYFWLFYWTGEVQTLELLKQHIKCTLFKPHWFQVCCFRNEFCCWFFCIRFEVRVPICSSSSCLCSSLKRSVPIIFFRADSFEVCSIGKYSMSINTVIQSALIVPLESTTSALFNRHENWHFVA